ncbi:unnamed protein product [Peniophora sp. CBMAI 1063]|nr:unnamed protein product [Peniophora sp. CBMAI 1063]
MLAEQDELRKFIEENLKSGRIRPSKSPMASPFFFIKKKDGSLRPVQDYRKLNEMTVKNRYPLPLIQELLDKLKGARYFTKLDVCRGYNNMRIKEGDERKAAFCTNMGLFELTVMFFGLTNLPATFQAIMNKLFRDLIHEGVVVVYLDNILIFTKMLEEHCCVTRKVSRILRENKLYLQPEKCEFEQTKIEYLGMIVEEGHVCMDPAKIKAVAKWAVPTRKKELQSFLGFYNFYHRFIKDFSHVSRPLHRLTGDVPWEWGIEQQLAFEELKLCVTSEPVLVIPVDDSPFRVEADASDFATGAVLSQKAADGKWHPVAYFSKSLSEAERNYEIYDKELLAIMLALEEWHQYLLGARHTFEIWSDHQNLTYFHEACRLNCCQAHWFTEMQEYDFTLHHKPGGLMGCPDALSREAGHERGENNNQDVVLLKPEFCRVLLHATAFDFAGEDKPTIRRIKDCTAEREESVELALLIKNPRWKEHAGGLLTHNNHIYVPSDEALRADIIKAHHDSLATGHPGHYKTEELITRMYWWPSIRKDIGRYVAGCRLCQRIKYRRESPHAPLQPNETPTRPFEVISMDFELKTFLCLYMDYHQSDWVKYLKSAQFLYNNMVHSSNHETPFHASEGRHPYSRLNPRTTDHIPAATSYAQHLKKVHEEITSALHQARETMKEVYNRHCQDACNYESKRPSRALNECRHGPFKILERIGASTYRLDIPPTWKTHNMFNKALLMPYTLPAFANQANPPEPPPEMINSKERYEVEAVINSKIIGRGTHRSMMYLVKWKGY